MKQQPHLGIVTATREVTQARALITDLYRLVDVFNVDIDFREQEAGVTDLARPEYPPLARTMSELLLAHVTICVNQFCCHISDIKLTQICRADCPIFAFRVAYRRRRTLSQSISTDPTTGR